MLPVRDYLSSELHTLELSDIAVRRDTPDAVHSMRKAARRLRSALQTYSDEIVVDHDLVDELRWLGRRLSPSRDLEVQWERLADRVAEIPVDSHREATRARIDEYFSARSEAARLEAVDTLDSDRYVGLLTRLDAAIIDLAPATEAAGARPKVARKELLRAVAALSKKVSRRVDRVGDAEDPAERDALMHRARKGAKRMRYAIEVIAPLHPKRSGRILDRFDDFQDLLGEFQTPSWRGNISWTCSPSRGTPPRPVSGSGSCSASRPSSATRRPRIWTAAGRRPSAPPVDCGPDRGPKALARAPRIGDHEDRRHRATAASWR